MDIRLKESLLNHELRASGEYPDFDEEVALARSAARLQTYYEWKLQAKKEATGLGRSNKVSIVKLLTGRS